MHSQIMPICVMRNDTMLIVSMRIVSMHKSGRYTKILQFFRLRLRLV
jgi:hypothetical protein